MSLCWQNDDFRAPGISMKYFIVWGVTWYKPDNLGQRLEKKKRKKQIIKKKAILIFCMSSATYHKKLLRKKKFEWYDIL